MSIHTALRWIGTWALLGLAAGLALMFGDTGHLPTWLLPPLVSAAGAIAGGLALVLLLVARRAIGPSTGGRRWRVVALAATAGGISMAALASPLGVRPAIAIVAGVAAGLISGLATARGPGA